MNNKKIKITIKKELRSLFRDKKTLIMTFLIPFFIPAFIFLYSAMFSDDMENNFSGTYNIGINYEMSMNETMMFSEFGLNKKYFKDLKSMEQAYNNEEIEAYVYYDSQINKYNLYMAENEAGFALESFFQSYNYQLGLIELEGEDIDTNKLFNMREYEVKPLNKSGMIIELILSMAFVYNIVSMVIAVCNVSTTATAVEKENGTLETLLSLPIKTQDLVLGKYFATTISSVVAGSFSLLLTIISMITAKLIFHNSYLNITINIELIIISFVVIILASFLLAALAVIITSATKTFKEAQASTQLLQTVSILPLFINLLNIKVTGFYYAIPIAGHIQLLMDIFLKGANNNEIIINITSTLVLSTILIYIMIKKYKTERVLFSI